jgi:membrane protein implicated in regulation of membrane protease activity
MRTLDPLVAALAVPLGVALIVLARWASRERGSRADTWLALRIGDVLFTEMLGAFLVAFAIGDLFATDDAPGAPRPGGFGRLGGRFGGGGTALPLPFVLGVVAAAVVGLARIDLGGLLLRARAADTESDYVGTKARVIVHIPAGGVGEIAMPDARGNVTSVAATADADLTVGTPVSVSAIRGRRLVVTRIDGS